MLGFDRNCFSSLFLFNGKKTFREGAWGCWHPRSSEKKFIGFSENKKALYSIILFGMPSGYIYQIFNKDDPSQFIIGSTTTTLKAAKAKFLYEMKNHTKRVLNPKLKVLAQTVPMDHWEIRELDRIDFVSRSELRKLQALYVRRNKPTLNVRYEVHSCLYCGKTLKPSSMRLHLSRACPIRNTAAFSKSVLHTVAITESGVPAPPCPPRT